ncbi:MAG TPA: competence/damage-inducible protein A [Caldithrix abyssi]|uniref:CinA-like protein n=1 Tax=Caldithrix abyssi TaxID=187145 RepID=A0A7V5H4E2_CALAY|nr:competence/damage-inducible protein A [Caldithrix abyssi]
MAPIKAELISIGNELLAGITINTNAAYLAKQLQAIGIEVKWITVIPDEHDEIVQALRQAKQRARVVISTGGLGPTPDDITKQALCDFFQVELEFHPQVFEDVQSFLNHRQIALNEVNRLQAVIPKCEQVLRNQQGTAPGLYFKRDDTHFFFLPGVPGEVYHLTEKDILPLLENIFNLKKITTHLLRTTGIPESKLIEKIGDLVEQHSDFKIAFLPRFRGVDLRFTLPLEKENLKTEFEHFIGQVRQRLAKYIFTEQEKELEEVIGEILIRKKLTLSVAESFTGGLIEDLLTNVPGSSAYFLGGAVTYSNESKMKLLGVREETLKKHGAVSEETVIEMVSGVQKLFNSDCAIATTGIAGPTGATAEKPVGLCYLAARVGDQQVSRKFQFGNDRLMNKHRGAIAALELLRRLLLNIQ